MRICSELENLSVLLEDMPRHSTCKEGKKKEKKMRFCLLSRRLT